MRTRHSGFSLVELLIVIAIIMVIAAMAIPNMMNAISNVRLRGSAGDVSGLLQQCRERAVRNNRYYTVRAATVGNARIAYVDLNYNLAYDGGPPTPEPMIQFASNVAVQLAGAPNTANLYGQAFPAGFVPLTVLPSFNARGLPCVGAGNAPPPANSVCNNNAGAVGFAYFLNQTRPFGQVGWAAVTVTPAGRIRVWTYDGQNWE